MNSVDGGIFSKIPNPFYHLKKALVPFFLFRAMNAKDNEFDFEKEAEDENISVISTNSKDIGGFSGMYYEDNRTIALTEDSDIGLKRHEFAHHIQLNTKHADDFELENCLDVYQDKMLNLIKDERLISEFVDNLPEEIIKEIKSPSLNLSYTRKIENYISGSMQIIQNTLDYFYPESRHPYEVEAYLVQYFGFKNTELICGEEMPTAKFFKEKQLKSLKSQKEDQQDL